MSQDQCFCFHCFDMDVIWDICWLMLVLLSVVLNGSPFQCDPSLPHKIVLTKVVLPIPVSSVVEHASEHNLLRVGCWCWQGARLLFQDTFVNSAGLKWNVLLVGFTVCFQLKYTMVMKLYICRFQKPSLTWSLYFLHCTLASCYISLCTETLTFFLVYSWTLWYVAKTCILFKVISGHSGIRRCYWTPAVLPLIPWLLISRKAFFFANVTV